MLWQVHLDPGRLHPLGRGGARVLRAHELAIRAGGVLRRRGSAPAPGPDRRAASRRRRVLLRSEKGRRGGPAAPDEQAPPVHLLGVSDHHDRDRRRHRVRPHPRRVARAATARDLPAALLPHRLVQPDRPRDDRVGDHPPHDRAAVADPVEPRRRPHPRRDRLPDAVALHVPRLSDRRRRLARSRGAVVDAGVGHDRHVARAAVGGSRGARPDVRLLAARPHPPDVPQLPALLQAHPPARRAAEHLRAQPLAALDGPPEARSRGRDAVGRRRVRAVLVEEPARHLRVHRVRALHELLPRVQHRQEPVADAARARHPLRDARSRPAARQDRQAREERVASPTTAKDARLRRRPPASRPGVRASATRGGEAISKRCRR